MENTSLDECTISSRDELQIFAIKFSLLQGLKQFGTEHLNQISIKYYKS